MPLGHSSRSRAASKQDTLSGEIQCGAGDVASESERCATSDQRFVDIVTEKNTLVPVSYPLVSQMGFRKYAIFEWGVCRG